MVDLHAIIGSGDWSLDFQLLTPSQTWLLWFYVVPPDLLAKCHRKPRGEARPLSSLLLWAEDRAFADTT